jgi:integrase
VSKAVWREPISEALKKLWNMDLGEARGLAENIIMKNWRSILKDVCFGLSAEDVATKYGFSRRSFFYFLERRELSFRALEEACTEEREARELSKRETLAQKQTRLKVIPKSIEEAFNDPFINEIIERKTAKGVTRQTVTNYVRTWLELMSYVEKHLEDITLEDMIQFINYKKQQAESNGVDTRSRRFLNNFSSNVITPLRVLALHRGLPVEDILETIEYEGLYRHVRISVEERYKILKYLKENYPRQYEALRGLLVTAYETGSRREGLWKGELMKITKFGLEIYVYRTEEKGRRAKIIWEKLIKPQWAPYIEQWVRVRDKISYDWARKALHNAYENVLEEGITKEYALMRPLHVWRHTATNDLLEETGYNLMVVAKRLGWKNVQMITKVYGDISEEMLLAMSGYGLKVERAKHEFLYNAWLERAREEGLL